MDWMTRQLFRKRLDNKQITTGPLREIHVYISDLNISDKIKIPPFENKDQRVAPCSTLNWYCSIEKQGFILNLASDLKYNSSGFLLIDTHFKEELPAAEDWKVIPLMAPLFQLLNVEYITFVETKYAKKDIYEIRYWESDKVYSQVYKAESSEESQKSLEALEAVTPNADYRVVRINEEK